MAKKKLTILIEIPEELRLTKAEIATLEGNFQTNVIVILQAKVVKGDQLSDETNVNPVSVTSKVLSDTSSRKGGSKKTTATKKGGKANKK